MKRCLLFLMLMLVITNIRAIGHIKFMGIELDGTFEDFKDSIEAKGFKYMSSYESLHKFYGKFANEIVTLEILASPKSKTVFKVIVYFPEKEEWSNLKNDYFEKKEMYKSKYPMDRDYEFFSSPYEDGDGYEMRAVARDKCRYVSFFFATGGYIAIEIDKSAKIKVVYEDRENIKIGEKELKQNAIDDI